MLGFLKSYLDKANYECKSKTGVNEDRIKIEQKVAEQNNRMNEDLKSQSKESIAVQSK